MRYPLLLSAVGDLSFQGEHADRPSMDVFAPVVPIFRKSDIALANLENPLFSGGTPVRGKCTLRGSPGWAEVLRDAGINLVTLANNHIMDYGEEGLFSTTRSLEASGIAYVGAGRNKEEACKAMLFELKEGRVAFLARSSVVVSSACYSTETRPGAAFFDVEETRDRVKRCKEEADIVVLLIHWGLEEYLYPSMEQRSLAAKLIDAGADLILGHHPHVLQGMERISNRPVIYSLGNFLFDEFEWTLNTTSGEEKKYFSSLSSKNRESVLLQVTWEGSETIRVDPVFTRIEKGGTVSLDSSTSREVFTNQLSKRLCSPVYPFWWRGYALKREWDLRLSRNLSFSGIIKRLWKIRFRHVRELYNTMRRSASIVSEKSTNPYED